MSKYRRSGQQQARKGSWEKVNRWYDGIVGKEGHYYHKNVILPAVDKILGKGKKPYRLLDLACGQGILARHLPKTVDYLGIDISRSLIASAKKLCPTRKFLVADASDELPIDQYDFDWVTCILAIQDIAEADKTIQNAAKHLKNGGRLLIVMNHPCFRIPRQSSWQDDEAQGMRYRRLNGYLSHQNIPIQTQPSKGKASETVTSHHRPLSSYFRWFADAGLVVEDFQEWISDKKSTGSKARSENRARKEFPLFACFICKKVKP